MPAVKAGLLYHKPHIELLRENNVRTGSAESCQPRAYLRFVAASAASRSFARAPLRMPVRLSFPSWHASS